MFSLRPARLISSVSGSARTSTSSTNNYLPHPTTPTAQPTTPQPDEMSKRITNGTPPDPQHNILNPVMTQLRFLAHDYAALPPPPPVVAAMKLHVGALKEQRRAFDAWRDIKEWNHSRIYDMADPRTVEFRQIFRGLNDSTPTKEVIQQMEFILARFPQPPPRRKKQ